MFETFKGSANSQSKVSSTPHIEIYPVLKADVLLKEDRRNSWLSALPDLIATSPMNYKLYYLPVLENFAEFVQNLPETAHGFFSHSGGFLDHGLERAVQAMKISQGYAQADAQADVAQEITGLWNYAIYTAALLFDVGKLVTKSIVTLRRQNMQRFRIWNPFEGSMLHFAAHYSYEFAAENFDALRRQVTPLVAKQMMPELGFSWLSSDKDILREWFGLLQEDYRQVSARMMSIPLSDAEILETYFQKYEKDLAQKKKIEKLALFKDPALLSKAAEASKKGGLFSKHAGEAPTGKEMEFPHSTVSAEAFLSWLKKNVANGKLSVNLPNSSIHLTKDGVLLLTKVFQDFIKENPVYDNWQNVKKQFEQLEIAKQTTGAGAQAFRLYSTSSEFKVLTGAILVSNLYMVFLHNRAIPDVNVSVVPVNLTAEALPVRSQNVDRMSASDKLNPQG